MQPIARKEAFRVQQEDQRAGHWSNLDVQHGPVARTVILLAWPILSTAILQSLASLVKMYWIAQGGRDALAAAALSETISFLLFPLIVGFSTGTAAIVGRAVGAADRDAAALATTQSLLLALIVGVCSTAAGRLFAHQLFHIVGADASVARAGEGYLKVLLVSAIPAFVLYVSGAALESAGQTAGPMIAAVAGSTVSVVAAPILMLGLFWIPALGLVGAAWASVLGNTVSSLLCLRILFRRSDIFRFSAGAWLFHWPTITRVSKIGLAGFGQLFMRIIANTIMMRIVATYGTSAIAAYGLVLRLDSVVLTPSFAFGGAAAALVGISLGQHQPLRARQAALVGTFANLCVITPIVVSVIAFADLIILHFNADMSVLPIAKVYIWIVWPSHFLTAACITIGRSMQGAGDTVSSMLVTIAGVWMLQLPVVAILAINGHQNIRAVWWVIAVAACAQCILMIWRFVKGGWKDAIPHPVSR